MIYQVKQRSADDRYEYTIATSEGIWPAGYCAAPSGPTPMKALFFAPGHMARYHDDGHATPAGARMCFKRYLEDTFGGPT